MRHPGPVREGDDDASIAETAFVGLIEEGTLSQWLNGECWDRWDRVGDTLPFRELKSLTVFSAREYELNSTNAKPHEKPVFWRGSDIYIGLQCVTATIKSYTHVNQSAISDESYLGCCKLENEI